MENIFVEFLPPWVETGLQPAFYDKESGTVLQQTARMYARVNMLIRMFNKLSKNTKEEVERFEGVINDEIERFEDVVNDTVEEYITKFNELHDYVQDYFDNLDVQQEINNKLDAMVADGTLTNIITAYLTLAGVLAFDTVASLASATNVGIGSTCMTFGYLRLGDGVYNRYKVREKTDDDVVDGYNIVSITSSEDLVAERLQYGDELVIELEPSDNIQSYLNIVGKKTIKMPKDTTITVQDVLRVNSDTEIDLNGSTVFFDYARPATFPLVDWDETLGFVGFGPDDTFTAYNGYKNITIRNGVIKGGCSCFMHNTNVLIEDVEFTTLLSRHAMQFASCYGVTVRRCIFNGTKHEEGAEHSADCINIDPCNYGGQPWFNEDSVMYDHSPNKFVVIENNTFNKATAEGQLYGCAMGSHGGDETGALICENFIATNNSLGEPYADAINVCDYDQVTISNNTVEFSTTTHDTYTFFVHCRGGLKNTTITDNLVENVGQFIYTDSNTRERKNLLIEGNTVKAIDLQGYAVMHLFHYENVNIQHNTIKCKYRAVHIDSLGSNPILYSVNANYKYNDVTAELGSDVLLRFRNVQGCQFIGNTINYLTSNNMASAKTLALQDGTTDVVVMHNRTSDPKHFVDISALTPKFMYNNAQYTLSEASGTTQSGTLASALTNFTKLVLQIGDSTATQVITLLPWLPHNNNKFNWGTDTSRTYKIPVVASNGTVSGASLTINDDNTYSYNGNVTLRGIKAYD